jgi:hypothetical protein
MRRDHFTVTARHVSSSESTDPTLTIEYNGPEETLTEQLTGSDDELFAAADIDAAFRLQDPKDAADASGVFSLTHRVTGEYLLEVNVAVEDVLSVVQTAREGSDDDPSYRIRIDREGADPVVYGMAALLVYDQDGNLLRQHSLIPSGVEL